MALDPTALPTALLIAVSQTFDPVFTKPLLASCPDAKEAICIPAYEIPADSAACIKSPPLATTDAADINGSAQYCWVATAAILAIVPIGSLIAASPTLPISLTTSTAKSPIALKPSARTSPAPSIQPPTVSNISPTTAIIAHPIQAVCHWLVSYLVLEGYLN